MKYDESPQRTRSQPGIEERFLFGGSKSFLTVMEPDDTSPTKIYENLLKYIKIHEIHENPRNTMKVLRGQEGRLDSSKGFYRGSRS